MPLVTVRAPTRLDFGGGWTDVPPYSTEQGGRVCNIAITRYATVTLREEVGEIRPSKRAADSALAVAALKRSALTSCSCEITSDFPIGAGLGGSSAAGVAMAAAIRIWRGLGLDDLSALAEASRTTEAEDLGIAGGRQDHYAAAWGGALDLAFTQKTVVNPIRIPAELRKGLEARCIVAYSGESRISGDTISAVMDAYERREPHVLNALAKMKALAGSMAAALTAGDIDKLGAAVGEHWKYQRSLHPAIPTPHIDELLASAIAAGALGGKALGASGGGCVMALAARGREDTVRHALSHSAEVLDFSIDIEGVKLLECIT